MVFVPLWLKPPPPHTVQILTTSLITLHLTSIQSTCPWQCNAMLCVHPLQRRGEIALSPRVQHIPAASKLKAPCLLETQTSHGNNGNLYLFPITHISSSKTVRNKTKTQGHYKTLIGSHTVPFNHRHAAPKTGTARNHLWHLVTSALRRRRRRHYPR